MTFAGDASRPDEGAAARGIDATADPVTDARCAAHAHEIGADRRQAGQVVGSERAGQRREQS